MLAMIRSYLPACISEASPHVTGYGRLHLGRKYGQDPGSAAHVQHLLVPDVFLGLHHASDYQRCGLVMPGAESHLGVDGYGVSGPGQAFMERGFYGAASIDDHGLEGGFPQGVPILLWYQIQGMAHLEVSLGNQTEYGLQTRLAELLLGNVGFQVRLLCEIALESEVADLGGHHFRVLVPERVDLQRYFDVFHPRNSWLLR